MSDGSSPIVNVYRANPRGWIIVLFIFAALSAVFSARAALGLIMPTWEQDLGWDRTFLSGGGSLVLVFMTLISPLAGNLLDRVGPRPVVCAALICVGASIASTSLMTEPWQFIVLFCIVGGLGYGSLAAPQASAAVAQIFEDYRGLATGIATSGASGGLLLGMPLLALAVEWVGWRVSFAGFGLIIIALAPIAWFLMTPASRTSASTDTIATGGSLPDRLRLIARNSTFWLLLTGFVICGFTTSGVIEVHLIPYAISCGYPRFESAAALGVLSGANMAGMILAGFLADRVHRPLLMGAIAGYLHLGLTAGLVMGAVETIQPGSFQPLALTKAALASGDLSVIESSGAFAEINYFAFVCLTTVGFGDINPALPLARMLSVVTSIAGPLYLAVVMGVLIGRFAGGNRQV